MAGAAAGAGEVAGGSSRSRRLRITVSGLDSAGAGAVAVAVVRAARARRSRGGHRFAVLVDVVLVVGAVVLVVVDKAQPDHRLVEDRHAESLLRVGLRVLAPVRFALVLAVAHDRAGRASRAKGYRRASGEAGRGPNTAVPTRTMVGPGRDRHFEVAAHAHRARRQPEIVGQAAQEPKRRDRVDRGLRNRHQTFNFQAPIDAVRDERRRRLGCAAVLLRLTRHVHLHEHACPRSVLRDRVGDLGPVDRLPERDVRRQAPAPCCAGGGR